MSNSSSISAAKLAANRANAQLSTGPNTPEGLKASAVNSVTHGLSSSPELLFAAHPAERDAYREHAQKLRKDCQPETNLEEDAFQRHAWATFQAKRARSLETLAEDRWLEDPDDAKRFSQMERVVKLAASQERRADKAMRELRQLQKDRFAAYEVYAEHCVMGEEVHIPKSLPTADIRKSDMGHTSPNYIAQFLLYQTKKVKDTAKRMLKDAKINAPKYDDPNEANPLRNLSLDELLKLAEKVGIQK